MGGLSKCQFAEFLALFSSGRAYWVLRGRFAAMSFEVKAGNNWGGVLTDIEYLIPSLGAFLAIAGGTAALLGRSGRTIAIIGTGLVILFAGLVFAMSGMMEMIQPFMLPAAVMLAATIGLLVTKPG